MSDAVRSLFALFDIDSGSAVTKLKEMNKETSSVKEALGTLAKTAIGAFSFHKITEFVGSMIELGSTLNDTSEKLGVGTDELQKFQMAAGLSGVNAEEAGRALQFLNKNMGEAVGGSKEAVQQFADMGIAIKDGKGDVRELGDVIPEVADAFANMGSDQERTAAAMKMFGKSGASLIPLLKQGSGELKRLSDQFDTLGLGIEDDFIKKADAAGDQIDILKLGFRSLKSRIAVEVLPSITAVATKFQGWIAWAIKATKETHIVKEAWWTMGAAGAAAAAKTIYSWGKVLGFFKGGSLWKNLLSMGELGLIIAGVLLLAGTIEDLVVMCQGGESVIGDLMTEFFGAERAAEFANELRGAWASVSASLEAIKPSMQILLELGMKFATTVLPYMLEHFVGLVKIIASAVTLLSAFVSAIAGIPEAIKTGSFDAIGKNIDKAGNSVFGKGGLFEGGKGLGSAIDGFNALTNPLSAAKWIATSETFNKPTISGSDPALRVGGGGGVTRGDTNVDITVNGGPTNEDTGRAIAKGVENGVSKADRRAAADSLFRGGPSDEE